LATGAVLMAAGAAVPAVGLRLASRGEALAAPPPPPAPPPPAAAPAAEELVAVLLPPQMADLSTRADARVTGVRARVGESVRQGDVIVAFDQRARKHDLEIAEAQLRVLRADSTVASSELAVATTRAGRRGRSTWRGAATRSSPPRSRRSHRPRSTAPGRAPPQPGRGSPSSKRAS